MSPQITGVELPFPGILIFHLTFSVPEKCSGASPSRDPVVVGPAPLMPGILDVRFGGKRQGSGQGENGGQRYGSGARNHDVSSTAVCTILLRRKLLLTG